MDSDEFVTRLNELADGLEGLADDLYAVAEGETVDGADSIVESAQRRLGSYEGFLAEIQDPDWVAETNTLVADVMEELRDFLKRIKSASKR